MKTIKLKDIKWVGTDQYHTPSQTKSYYGTIRSVKKIVIHWWGDPKAVGTFRQTVNYLKGAKNKSIHFVVSNDSVTQMVNMKNTAWHAGNCNPVSVGIEVDPKTPGNTYETVGALVKFIRTYYGNIPIVPHKSCAATSCPGTISLAKIDAYAKGRVIAKVLPKKPIIKVIIPPKPAPAPEAKKPSKDDEQDTRLNNLEKLLNSIASFLESIFNKIFRR